MDTTSISADAITVVIDTPDTLTHLGIAHALSATSDIMAKTPQDTSTPDVRVLAIPRLRNDIAAKLRQHAESNPTPTVLITDDLTEQDLLTAIECKVVAVIPRPHVTTDRLTHAIRAAAAGGAVIPPSLLGALINHVEQILREFTETRGTNRQGLAQREIDVLRLMAEGHDTIEVAQKLCYSERTIKNILSSVMGRLNLRNRSHAIAYALRAGLI